MNATKESLGAETSAIGETFKSEMGSGGMTEAVERGEACVQRHPESAVLTTFLAGLVLGSALGWFLAEQQEQPWRRDARRMVRRVRRRMQIS